MPQIITCMLVELICLDESEATTGENRRVNRSNFRYDTDPFGQKLEIGNTSGPMVSRDGLVDKQPFIAILPHLPESVYGLY